MKLWAAARHFLCRQSVMALAATMTLAVISGCIPHPISVTSSRQTIPARRLPAPLAAAPRGARVPVDPRLLGQPTPRSYRLAPGDTVGIFVQSILPANIETTPVVFPLIQESRREHFPATGLSQAGAIGIPVEISTNGMVPLPLIEQLPIAGLTLEEAAEKIRENYVRRKLVQPGRDQTIVSIMKPRRHRVLVIRQDLDNSVATTYNQQRLSLLTKRGSSDVIDLQAYENDVLHALIATGGMPGQDAEAEVWILRGAARGHHVGPSEPTVSQPEVVPAKFEPGAEPIQPGVPELRSIPLPPEVVRGTRQVRVPLAVDRGLPLPFGPQDVLLEDGDVVVVPARIGSYYYTGGLLPAAQIPLPRDYDLDILEAIALPRGNPGGLQNVPAQYREVFQDGVGPIVKPTRALVIRTLPDGQQITIRVELDVAVRLPAERVIIQPNDVIVLYHTPRQFAANLVLGLAHFNGARINGIERRSSSSANAASNTTAGGATSGS